MNFIAISDLRTNLPSIIKNVSEKFERLVVTISGKPKAVVISLEELESLEETAEILAVPNALKDIRESRKQIKKGQSITLEKLKKKHNIK